LLRIFLSLPLVQGYSFHKRYHQRKLPLQAFSVWMPGW